MISKKLVKMLNDQINEEFYSSYLYLSMSAHFLSLNLNGFAHWMKIQVREELNHGMKIFEYLYERNESATLDAIKKPPVKWDSPLKMFEETLKHEKHISERFNILMTQAIEDKDYATQNFLQWFISEQVEEEASALENINKMNLIGDSRGSLYMLDRELGKRE
jgi:ferritin